MTTYTVHYRRADGKGTQTYLSGLKGVEAQRIKQQIFDRDPTKTMVWVLDGANVMLGDALIREPAEDESTRIARAT